MPSFTLTVDVTQAQRIATAFGRYWQLKDAQGAPRDATAAEIKTFLVRQLKGVVVQQERNAAQAAIAEPADLTVT